MTQRMALILASVLTAFLLVLSGGVIARVSQGDVKTAAAAPVAATPASTDTQASDTAAQVQAIIQEREAAYRDLIRQANERLQAAEQQAAALQPLSRLPLDPPPFKRNRPTRLRQCPRMPSLRMQPSGSPTVSYRVWRWCADLSSCCSTVTSPTKSFTSTAMCMSMRTPDRCCSTAQSMVAVAAVNQLPARLHPVAASMSTKVKAKRTRERRLTHVVMKSQLESITCHQ